MGFPKTPRFRSSCRRMEKSDTSLSHYGFAINQSICLFDQCSYCKVRACTVTGTPARPGFVSWSLFSFSIIVWSCMKEALCKCRVESPGLYVTIVARPNFFSHLKWVARVDGSYFSTSRSYGNGEFDVARLSFRKRGSFHRQCIVPPDRERRPPGSSTVRKPATRHCPIF